MRMAARQTAKKATHVIEGRLKARAKAMFTTKPWVAVLLLFVLMTVFEADALDKVTISHSVTLSATVAPLFYGIQRGFFRDENIDLDYRVLRADIGIKALLNGEVDYIYSASTATRASIRGLPIRALSYDLERLLHFLMGRPGVRTASDLKGKIIGVSSFGASGDVAARACLRSMGVDPKKDVTLVAVGADSVRYNALKAGSVEAIIAPLPRNLIMKKEGFNELCYAGRLSKGTVGGVITTIDRIHSKPEQAKAMLRAMLRTSRSLNRERSDFVEFLVTRIKLDRDIAKETASLLSDGQTKNGIIEESDLQAVIDSERQFLQVEKPVKPSDVADYRLLKQVLSREGDGTSTR